MKQEGRISYLRPDRKTRDTEAGRGGQFYVERYDESRQTLAPETLHPKPYRANVICNPQGPFATLNRTYLEVHG